MKTTTIALSLLAAALLAAVGWTQAAGGPQSSGGKDAVVEAAAAKYDSAHWPAGERRVGCELGALTLSALTGRPCERTGAAVTRRFADAQNKDVLLVEMVVADTAKAAHAKLLDHIAFVQSVKTLPTAQSRGIPAGDVGFVGFGNVEQDKIAWLAFVAGNVEFRVMSLDPGTPVQPNVRDAVARLNALVQQAATVPAGSPIPAPAIENLAADPTSWASRRW